ncbi:MAG: hypothetical protein KAR47_02520, partial [Planctomycetes bacterium]|nr:hypothetical protein [Planctomycetota bacterium]
MPIVDCRLLWLRARELSVLRRLLGNFATFVFVVFCLSFAVSRAEGSAARSGLGDGPGQSGPESLRAAVNDLVAVFGAEYPDSREILAELSVIERDFASAKAGGAGARDEVYKRLVSLQRRALFANPLVGNDAIVFVVRNQYEKDHHNTATLFQTDEINTEKFEGPGALKVMRLRGKGGAVKWPVKTLLEVADGVIRDPEVSFDGRKIVFSMRRDIADDYHIYEIDADGSDLRQLTYGGGVSDIDPVYLPDGGIVFSSTREPKYCMCNRHIMANLFRMDADGANIHQIGKSTLFEGHSSVLADGRILYDRWEYVDRNFGDAQALWTVRPDGTSPSIYWGNNTWSPGGVIDARGIGDTGKAVCIFTSCHDRPWGAMAIIDRRLGMDGVEPVVRMWPADAAGLMDEPEPRQEGKYGFDRFKQVMPKYEDPYPLSDKYFLVSRSTGEGKLDSKGQGTLAMGIFLVDVFGNEVLIHTEGAGCYDPAPLRARMSSSPIPPSRDFDNADGYFYITDVYRGTHMKGVKRGDVRFLRVIESPEKRNWTNLG